MFNMQGVSNKHCLLTFFIVFKLGHLTKMVIVFKLVHLTKMAATPIYGKTKYVSL